MFKDLDLEAKKVSSGGCRKNPAGKRPRPLRGGIPSASPRPGDPGGQRLLSQRPFHPRHGRRPDPGRDFPEAAGRDPGQGAPHRLDIRVEVGVHTPQDIYAGRVLGQAIAQALLRDPAFQEDLAAVKLLEVAARPADPAGDFMRSPPRRSYDPHAWPAGPRWSPGPPGLRRSPRGMSSWWFSTACAPTWSRPRLRPISGNWPRGASSSPIIIPSSSVPRRSTAPPWRPGPIPPAVSSSPTLIFGRGSTGRLPLASWCRASSAWASRSAAASISASPRSRSSCMSTGGRPPSRAPNRWRSSMIEPAGRTSRGSLPWSTRDPRCRPRSSRPSARRWGIFRPSPTIRIRWPATPGRPARWSGPSGRAACRPSPCSGSRSRISRSTPPVPARRSRWRRSGAATTTWAWCSRTWTAAGCAAAPMCSSSPITASRPSARRSTSRSSSRSRAFGRPGRRWAACGPGRSWWPATAAARSSISAAMIPR